MKILLRFHYEIFFKQITKLNLRKYVDAFASDQTSPPAAGRKNLIYIISLQICTKERQKRIMKVNLFFWIKSFD